MKKMSIFALSCFVSAILIFYSCQKDEMDEVIPTEVSKGSMNLNLKSIPEINSDLDVFAQIVQEALQIKEFRLLLHEMASQKFDGTWDVLYMTIKSRTIGDKTVDELFTEICIAQGQKASFLDRIYKKPTLQISVPVKFRRWNPETEIPVVAYKPADFQQGVTQNITGIKSDGSTVLLDANKDPNFTVIAVGHCERTDDYGNLRRGFSDIQNNIVSPRVSPNLGINNFVDPLKEGGETPPAAPTNLTCTNYNQYSVSLSWTDNSSYESYFLVESTNGSTWTTLTTSPANDNQVDYQFPYPYKYSNPYRFRVRAVNSYGSSNFSNIVYGFYSDRNMLNAEYIESIKYTNLNAVESWIDGAPDTRLAIAANGWATPIFDDFITGDYMCDREDVDNVWLTINRKVIEQWDPRPQTEGGYGSVLNYKFTEWDNAIQSMNINIPYLTINPETGQISSYGNGVTINITELEIPATAITIAWHYDNYKCYELSTFKFITKSIDEN